MHLNMLPLVAVVAQASPESTWKEAAGRLQIALLVGDRFGAREALDELAKLHRTTEEQERRFKELKRLVEELEKSSL